MLVDDHDVGRIPFEGRIAPGNYRVRVDAEGQKSWETRVEVEAGQVSRVRVQLQPETDRGSGWSTMVLSLVFLAGGITGAVLANDVSSSLAQARDAGTLATDDPRLDRGLYYAIGADVGFGFALLFGALSIYFFARETSPASEGHNLDSTPIAVTPYFDPRGAGGLAVAGRF